MQHIGLQNFSDGQFVIKITNIDDKLMKSPIDDTLKQLLQTKLEALEKELDADVLVYYGSLAPVSANLFAKVIEDLKVDTVKRDKLYVILTTLGGSAEVVERYVNILRYHYKEVNFIVPDYAYSAGTIFCMSGDSILMDYISVLGPIDPQVPNKDNKYVAALGYLDKINEFMAKDANGTLTKAELIWLKELDLGEIRSFEQARDLTTDLLTKWLATYKFKNWTQHQDNTPVTPEEKQLRAVEIATELSDNKKWKSHGKGISIAELRALKLKIEDYGEKPRLRLLIRDYYNAMDEYVRMKNINIFIQNRVFI